MSKGLIGNMLLAFMIGGMLLLAVIRLCDNFSSSFCVWDRDCRMQDRAASVCQKAEHPTSTISVPFLGRFSAGDAPAGSVPLPDAVELRNAALLNLGREGLDEELIEAYVTLALEGNECSVGKTAVNVLGGGSQEDVLPSLETIALEAPCVEVRKTAVRCIEQFGSREAREALTRIVWQLAH